VTGNLRKFYVKAYLGITSDKAPKYWLVFQASVPPMGWNSYYISKPTGAGESYLFGLNCNYDTPCANTTVF